MQCPNCLTESLAQARFCPECGTSLAPCCPGCGAKAPLNAKFCSECGERLSSVAVDRVVPEAERRQLSVMFCDLVGSTDFSTRLDPEDWREVVRAYQSAGEKVVARYGGNIAQYLGDGLLVYFGYPQAHEDDAQRAVRAGLGILRAIRALNPDLETKHGIHLDVRIGIDTGLVVAGEVGGDDHRENLALGETPNLAARLQGMANPGSLTISAATLELVRGYFVVRDLGLHELKGVPRPLPVFEVLQEEAARSRMDIASTTGLTPLAARESEISLLSDLWGMAKNGRGQVVTISGEAGIGKSRLVHELQNSVSREENTALATCLASPYYQETALYPLIDYIERSVLASDLDGDPEDKLSRLEGWLVQFGLQLDEVMPLFSSLLALPSSPEYPPVIQDPERQKQKLMESLLRILLSKGSAPTLMIVFEDLHWADATTLELLELLIPITADVRIMIILTSRPEFLPPWRMREHITPVNLHPLDRRSAAEVASWVSREVQLPPAVLEQVISQTDGNPLFLEELSKMVIESGAVANANEHRQVPGRLSRMAIPATLHDSLMARLDLLGGVKTIAQMGATLGREFSYELLKAVMQLPEIELQQGLQTLVDGEFLFQRGIAPRSEYVFKHALIQEAAYQAVLKSNRQQYHKRIADVLVQQFPELAEKQPELIARHYTEAGLANLAIPYWQAAGSRALQSAANAEAIAHLNHALDLLASVPQDESATRQELELQTLLAPAYMAIKGWASHEVERASRRAHELGVSLGDFQASFGSLWGVCMNDFLRGRLNEALVTGKQVFELGGDSDQAIFDIMSRHAVGYVRFYRGEFQEALELSERALERFDLEVEKNIVLGFQFASSSALRIMNGCSLWMLGFPDRSPGLVSSAVELTRELHHYPSEAFALGASLLFHHYRLDIDSADEASEQLLDLAAREDFEIWSPFAHMFRGWVMSERGQHESGITETRLGIAQWRETGSYLNDTITTAMLGRMLWKAGRSDEALSTLDEAIVASEERSELQFAPELHRLRGEILIERGMTTEGELSMENALSLARAQSARMLELRAANSLARVMEQTDRGEQAHLLLKPIYDWFKEGFGEPDLREARELLVRFGSLPPSSASVHPASVTK